jgi:S-formylglutathione hydrolase
MTPSICEHFLVSIIVSRSHIELSCRNFIDKAGAFAAAVKYKVFIVCPDTSPRGVDIAGDSESWDFGKGAGFYVNATEPKWKDNYRLFHVIMNQRFKCPFHELQK